MTEIEQQESKCTHYWLLDRPNGPTSQGVCKVCGERAEFKNSMQGTGWDRDGQGRKRVRHAKR